MVTVNNRLKFEIEIVHDLSCHPIYLVRAIKTTTTTTNSCSMLVIQKCILQLSTTTHTVL